MNGVLSLVFFSIEFLLLIFVIRSSGKNKTNYLFTILLVLLAVYQFFEFLICGMELKIPVVTYLAFVTITFMPPLGLFAVWRLGEVKSKYTLLIFLPAAFFTVYYLTVLSKFEVLKCTPYYAAYNYPLGFLYGLFYYLPVLVILIISLYKSYFVRSGIYKIKLWKIIFWGYAITFIPGFIVTRIFPEMFFAVESILCKFAFILFWFIVYFIKSNKTTKAENN